MDSNDLKKYAEAGLSIRDISTKTNKSFSTIKYWLNKYNIKTLLKPYNKKESIIYGEYRYCTKCKTDQKTTNFYAMHGIPFSSTYCKQCASEQSIIRMKNFKLKCVEYKGGKCIICKYDKYIGALEFHHLDRNTKMFSISSLRSYSFNKKVIDELNKCALLCANCHREVEAGLLEIPA